LARPLGGGGPPPITSKARHLHDEAVSRHGSPHWPHCDEEEICQRPIVYEGGEANAQHRCRKSGNSACRCRVVAVFWRRLAAMRVWREEVLDKIWRGRMLWARAKEKSKRAQKRSNYLESGLPRQAVELRSIRPLEKRGRAQCNNGVPCLHPPESLVVLRRLGCTHVN